MTLLVKANLSLFSKRLRWPIEVISGRWYQLSISPDYDSDRTAKYLSEI